MRIILLTIPRSGSVSLLKGFSECLSYTRIGEPFNLQLRNKTPNLDKNNIVVKTFIDQVPSNVDSNINFYAEFIKNFDKVILISRKDLKSAAESYAYNLKHSSVRGWENRYYYNNEGLDVEHWLNWYNILHSDLETLSKIINKDIDWYEDIFSGNLTKVKNFLLKHNLEINTSEFLNYVDPNNRYRLKTPIVI